MKSKAPTKATTKFKSPPTIRLTEQILIHLQNCNGAFIAADIARAINYPMKETGYFDTCPQIRRVLTKLCKNGVLYQWITGNGMSPSAISNTPKYNVNYLKRNSDLASILLKHPNRQLVGYRFR
jgi:hypothetical protein